MCCETMKRYLFPAKREGFYINHRDGVWTIEVDAPEVWEMVAITYCPFCGTLLEA